MAGRQPAVHRRGIARRTPRARGRRRRGRDRLVTLAAVRHACTRGRVDVRLYFAPYL